MIREPGKRTAKIAVVLALVGVFALALTALSSGAHKRSALAAQYPPKVTICHKPGTPAQKTMKVPASAVKGHRKHGDTLGACSSSSSSSAKKGKAKGKRK